MSDEQVRQLNRKMDKVLFILHNDEETGKPGLVAEVTDIRNKFVTFVAQYNMDQANKKGAERVWKMVWGAIGAGVASFVWWLLKGLATLLHLL